jgi:hypothetical protein
MNRSDAFGRETSAAHIDPPTHAYALDASRLSVALGNEPLRAHSRARFRSAS